jgi:phage-related protein
LNTIILNSDNQVSDQGLSALGAGIKELRSLNNLSLTFRYFNLNYLVKFTKPFCEVPATFWGELFVVTFTFFVSVVYRSAKGAESFVNTIILNSGKQVSDQSLSALGTGIRELRSLTNLSLTYRYFK